MVAVGETGVDPHTIARRFLPSGDHPRAGKESFRVLRIDPELEGVPGAGHLIGKSNRWTSNPAAISSCCSTRSMPVTRLGDRVFHLQPGVHFQEHKGLGAAGSTRHSTVPALR